MILTVSCLISSSISIGRVLAAYSAPIRISLTGIIVGAAVTFICLLNTECVLSSRTYCFCRFW